MKKFVAALIVLVILVGAIIALSGHKTNDQSTQATSTPSTSTSQPPTSQAPAAETQSTSVITYSSSGFSPASLTVNAGSIVTLKNTSSMEVQFNSDPHPIHTDDPELNLGTVQPGQSSSFKVTTKGTHGYHNHLDSSQTGTLIVN